jgi:hypothetical protein
MKFQRYTKVFCAPMLKTFASFASAAVIGGSGKIPESALRASSGTCMSRIAAVEQGETRRETDATVTVFYLDVA